MVIRGTLAWWAMPTYHSWPDLNTGTDQNSVCLGFHDLSRNFMSEDTWIGEVAMAYLPHLDVGGAERASLNLDDNPAFRTNRIRILLDRKATW
jgi:hypothetical protein